MATWNKTKVNASDVNNGNQFNVGDGVRNTDINRIFESGLYSQDIVEHIGIGTVTTSASGSDAKASITYDSTTHYTKLILTLPRGVQGEKGEPGTLGNIKKLVFSGYLIGGKTYNFTSSTSSKLLLITFDDGDGHIIDISRGNSTFSFSRSQMEAQDRVNEYFFKLDITTNSIKMRDSYIWMKGIIDGKINVDVQNLNEIYGIKVYSLDI